MPLREEDLDHANAIPEDEGPDKRPEAVNGALVPVVEGGAPATEMDSSTAREFAGYFHKSREETT